MNTDNELVKVISDSGVEQSTALTLQNSFMPFFEKAREWKEKAEQLVVTDASQTREMKMAREARLALKDIRLEADRTRKALKEDSLRYGKAVQGVYNVIEYLIAPIEKHLEDQEKFAERQEAKRRAELAESRGAELQPYAEFVPYQVDLGVLNEEAWNTLINGAKLQHQAKVEADRKAEEERIAREKAESEERERIRLENIRLKAEAEEAEKARKAAEAAARKEREAAEERQRKADSALAEQKRLAEELKAKQEAQIAAERAEAARVAAELKAQLDAELKAKRDAEEAEQRRLAEIKAEQDKADKAPDKEKLTAWINDVNICAPPCSTQEGINAANAILTEFDQFKLWANEVIGAL